jgi:hypothetical protein
MVVESQILIENFKTIILVWFEDTLKALLKLYVIKAGPGFNRTKERASLP